MKHGGDLSEAEARHGAGDPPWLDLSTGINPHSWPVPEALRRTGWERLPGRTEMDALLAAARSAYRIPEGAEIVAAPGTQALIQWLPRLAPPGAALILGPTYGEHETSWRMTGREAFLAHFPEEDGHPSLEEKGRRRSRRGGMNPALRPATVENARAAHPPTPDLRSDPPPPGEGGKRAGLPGQAGFLKQPGGFPPIAGANAAHVVLVNPNNPDGRVLDPATVRQLAQTCARAGGWLVVDEAFADLDPEIGAADLLPDLPVIVLRSFGKFYGLAGLRLGFAIAPPAIADRLRAALGDWAVSGPALVVGAAALADQSWAESTRRRLSREAAALDHVLKAGGLSPAGGTSLFRLVRHPAAAALHERLASEHIWCRSFDWAPDLLRFGLPPGPDGLDRLRAALAGHVQGTSTA